MKKINFITPISPREQRAIAQWYRVACLFGVVMVCGIVAVHGWQLSTFLAARKEYQFLAQSMATCTQVLDEYDVLAQRREQLAQDCVRLQTIGRSMARAQLSLALLKDAATNSITFTSLNLHESALNASFHASNAQSGVAYMHTFNSKPEIKQVELLSIQPSSYAGTPTMLFQIRCMLMQ